MADTKASRLEQLKKRQHQLKAQINKIESAEKVKNRKEDTRRKILIGAYYLEQAEKSGQSADLNKKMLDYLSRESDRKLFIR